MREWDRVKDDKIEVETKKDMKDRVGRSPDFADWAAGVVEMARRKGFVISKLGSVETSTRSDGWLQKFAAKQRAMLQSKELTTV